MSYENFVRVKVVTPVTNVATSFAILDAVAPQKLPPTDGGYLVLCDSPGNPSWIEVIKYTSRTGLGISGVTRGQEGTTAVAWTGNVYAFQALMAGEANLIQSTLLTKANLDSPAFTGTPTMPTAPNGTSNSQGASTNFVQQEFSNALSTASPLMDGTGAAGTTYKVSREDHRHPTDTSRAPLASPAFTGTVTGITKAMVGLSNVDNTADSAKPVSTPQQTALNLKATVLDTQNGALTRIGTIAGSGAITGVVPAPFTAYVNGQHFDFIAASDNPAGGTTLNLNGLGAVALTKNGTVVLDPGDIKAGAVVTVAYDGTRFQIISGAGGGAIGGVFYENNQTVTADYTLSTGKNAMTAGPISIATGVTVTVPTGSTWSIV